MWIAENLSKPLPVELLAELIGRDATVLVRHPDAAEVLNALVARQNAIALQLSAQLGRNS